MDRRSGKKKLRCRLTHEELGRIEQAAKRWKEARNHPLASRAESLLRQYRDYQLDRSPSDHSSQVSRARDLAREALVNHSPLLPDYIKGEREKSVEIAKKVKEEIEKPTVGNLPLSNRGHWFNDWFNATTSLQSYELLRLTAAEFIERGDPLPHGLREYILDILRQPLPPPSDVAGRGGRNWRDRVISDVLFYVALHTRLNPTRNHTQRAKTIQSVCSIVSEVLRDDFKLNLSEDSIEKLWLADREMQQTIREEHESVLFQLSQLLSEASEE
jgi:hypothetical protein